MKKPKAAAVFGTAPKAGKKKKIPDDMGGMMSGKSMMKPERDKKPPSRGQVRGARMARLSNKLI